jgi:hypothetical protein
MPLAQKPSMVRAARARAAATPILTVSATPGTGPIVTPSRSVSMPLSASSCCSAMPTHGAAPMRRPFTHSRSPRRAPMSDRITRNQ